MVPSTAAYALALPRTLYGDDINGNTSNMMMTQSMDPAHLAARLLDNNTTPTVLAHRDAVLSSDANVGIVPCINAADLMTASLDPTMLRELDQAAIQVIYGFTFFFFFRNESLPSLFEKFVVRAGS